MRRKDSIGKNVEVRAKTMDEVDELLRKYSVKLKNNKGYDAAYLTGFEY